MEDLIVLKDASVSFGERKALDSINLFIRKGEVVFVTGPSGAGKTTLLNVLSGINRPTSGARIDFLNKKNGEKYFISNVFQELRLISKLSCEENIHQAFDSKVYKNKKEFLNDRNELCRYLGILERLKLKINEANGGLKQKVAIVRALLSRPEIFIADEPTSSLDKDNARKIFDLLNMLNSRRKLTVIWASHSQELVGGFGGRVVHLDRGKLVYTGNACFI